jgi:hypothetical protein
VLCPFSCRGRNFCPSCEKKKKQLLWAEWLHNEVLAPVRVGYIMGTGDAVPLAIRGMGLEVSLLDFVRAGGTLITQYQQPDFVRSGLPPYPVEMSRPRLLSNYRVTDETAPITVLEPRHPVFQRPNVLPDQDWDGWVQEMSLCTIALIGEVS